MDHLVSFCHLVPPQDTKWHKVSLSGKDTKWHKVFQIVSFVMSEPWQQQQFYKSRFYANKEGSKRNSTIWKMISDSCGFHGGENSYNQLKSLNLVTMATNKIV